MSLRSFCPHVAETSPAPTKDQFIYPKKSLLPAIMQIPQEPFPTCDPSFLSKFKAFCLNYKVLSCGFSLFNS